ncbi:hypothetical protein [Fusobacterium varium]|uniref:hypothetical protein n=1 Tax=Fusobacterium varium TaxID=856 RepID=UPI00356A0C59
MFFFALTSMSFSNSEEINREEIRKLEKAEAKDEIQLNELEENIEAIGDEIRSIIIDGNTLLLLQKSL